MQNVRGACASKRLSWDFLQETVADYEIAARRDRLYAKETAESKAARLAEPSKANGDSAGSRQTMRRRRRNSIDEGSSEDPTRSFRRRNRAAACQCYCESPACTVTRPSPMGSSTRCRADTPRSTNGWRVKDGLFSWDEIPNEIITLNDKKCVYRSHGRSGSTFTLIRSTKEKADLD